MKARTDSTNTTVIKKLEKRIDDDKKEIKN